MSNYGTIHRGTSALEHLGSFAFLVSLLVFVATGLEGRQLMNQPGPADSYLGTVTRPYHGVAWDVFIGGSMLGLVFLLLACMAIVLGRINAKFDRWIPLAHHSVPQ